MSQQVADACDEASRRSLDQRKKAFKKMHRLVSEIFVERRKTADTTLYQIEIETILRFLLKTTSVRLQADALRILQFVLNHNMGKCELNQQIVDFTLRILRLTITDDPYVRGLLKKVLRQIKEHISPQIILKVLPNGDKLSENSKRILKDFMSEKMQQHDQAEWDSLCDKLHRIRGPV